MIWTLEDFFMAILGELPPAVQKHAAKFVAQEHLDLLLDGHEVDGDLTDYVQAQSWWPAGLQLVKRGGTYALEEKRKDDVIRVINRAARQARKGRERSERSNSQDSEGAAGSPTDTGAGPSMNHTALFQEFDRRRREDAEIAERRRQEEADRAEERYQALLNRYETDRYEHLQQLQEIQRIQKYRQEVDAAAGEWTVEVYKHLARAVCLLENLAIPHDAEEIVGKTVRDAKAYMTLRKEKAASPDSKKCYTCNSTKHLSRNCPKKSDDLKRMLQDIIREEKKDP